MGHTLTGAGKGVKKMERVLDGREAIYDFFDSSKSCQEFFFRSGNEDNFAAYYTSMVLLQDTSDAILAHRAKDFSDVPLQAYIEFWGIMQAVSLQQEALEELYRVIGGENLALGGFPFWGKIREKRNELAGRPAKKDRTKKHGVRRSFFGAHGIKYSGVRFEQYTESGPTKTRIFDDTGITTMAAFGLGDLITGYAGEADEVLQRILSCMEDRWGN